jgi:hypothetical protein
MLTLPFRLVKRDPKGGETSEPYCAFGVRRGPKDRAQPPCDTGGSRSSSRRHAEKGLRGISANHSEWILTTDLGIPGQVDHPRLRAAYEREAAACRTHKKVLGVGGIRHNTVLQGELIGL